jgi:hypothetical protein
VGDHRAGGGVEAGVAAAAAQRVRLQVVVVVVVVVVARLPGAIKSLL